MFKILTIAASQYSLASSYRPWLVQFNNQMNQRMNGKQSANKRKLYQMIRTFLRSFVRSRKQMDRLLISINKWIVCLFRLLVSVNDKIIHLLL